MRALGSEGLQAHGFESCPWSECRLGFLTRGNDFLAGQRNIDSFIFHYSLEEDHLVLFQQLPTRGALHIASFTLGHSHFADTFLAVANSCEDEDGGSCNPHTNSAIYQFTGKKFVLFQEVPTLLAVQWLAVQVEGTVLLAVAQMVAGVKLFQYDGWRFVATKIQHYEGSFGPGATGLAAAHWNGTVVLGESCFGLEVTCFGWEGTLLYGRLGLERSWSVEGTVIYYVRFVISRIAVSSLEHQDSLFHSLDVFRLTFRKNTRLKAVHSDYEAWCVAALREAKQTELVASLVSGIQAATNQTYVFTSHVTIKGSLTAGLGSFVTQTFERTTSRHLPVLTGGITQLLLTLGSKVQQAVVRISNAVSLSDPISWPVLEVMQIRMAPVIESALVSQHCSWQVGDLHLYDLSAGSASAERLYVHDVNQRVVSWRDAVMLEGIDLQYMARLRLDHVEIKAVTQIANLKGQPFSSFVTLSGHHTIFGHVSFSAAIRVASLIAVTVDKVVITPQYVLIADDSQYLNGSLTCQYLNAVSLEVVTINGVPLSPLLSSLVLKDARSAVNGLVRVMGNLAYHGNLQVNLSLPLDLKNVIKVDYAGLQVVTGGHQVGELAAPSMAIEGRLNNMRVPAEVFLNGSHHSYIVVSAAFSHVRAISVFIFQKLHNLTVTEGRLDVLLLSGYQIVTAPKTFTSLQLLEQNAPNYRSASIRRRRWSSENCELPRNRRPKTLTARIETLFLVLRGVAAAQDLLIFLTEIQPGQFLVPGQNLNFFNLLMQNVDCAILYLENNGNLKLHETLDAIKWHNTTVFIQNELPTDNMTEMIGNIQSYLVQEKLELKKVTLNADDLLLINNLKKADSTRRDLLILDYLIDITSNHELENLPSEIFHRNCLLFCPAFHENIRDRKKMQMSCIPEILTVFKAMKTISKYSAIITEMKQLSAHSYQILKAGVVRYLLGQLLRSVSEKKELRKQVYAAVVCRLSPEGSEEYQQMLITYRRELHQNTSRFIHSRIKRQASEAAYGLTDPEPPSTLPASNSEDTSTIPLSFNEDANENSSTLQDSVIENTSQDSSTLSASTTEATSEDSPTLSVSARKNIGKNFSTLPSSTMEDTSKGSSTFPATPTENSSGFTASPSGDITDHSSALTYSVFTTSTSTGSSAFILSTIEGSSSFTAFSSDDLSTLPAAIPEDTSQDSSAFTVSIIDNNSEDSSALPLSVTEDTSEDSSTLQASVTEDTNEDSSTLPTSITEDTIEDSSTLPASVTDETSGDSSILPASITDETSGDSSIFPASITEDTSGDSSTPPASITEDTSGDPSIFPASITEDTSGDSFTLPVSVTEDTSGDSSTFTAYVTEDTSGDSSILPASVTEDTTSVTEDTSGDSSTLPAYVTEDTSGDSSNLLHSVIDNTSEGSSTLLASFIEDTSGDSSTLPPSVIDSTNEGSSTLPTSVTEDTSGDSSTIPSSVIDSTSEGYSTLPASVTEDTSGDSSTLPASITENTSEDSSTLPASITEDTSEDSSTLPASITEDTSGDSSTLPASITEDSSENSSVTPYRREDANEDSSTHILSIGEINTAFAAATTEFFSSSLDSSTFTGSTNEISFNFSTLAPLSVSPSSMYGDSVFLSARAGLLSELRELETTVAVDSDKTTQILGFQTTDEKTTPEDHVTDSILRLSTTGNAQITGIFADILGLRTTEGTSESMDSVTVDLKGTIDLTAISGSQTVGITGNEIADPETIPEAGKPNFTTDITKTSTTTVTDVTEDSSPNTMTEKATESSVVTDKDITNPFTIVNNNMEVNLSQTDADAILVPLKVSLNYENCSTLPPNLLQDSNRLMYLYRRMQMTDDYFSTVVRLLPELKVPKEPSQYDVGVEGAMLDAFGFLIDTVKKFVLDPIGFLGYETTSHPFAYSDDMPEIVKNMSEEFKTNSALIKNLMILLNFTKNVVAVNPYLNKRCPAPHAIDPEGVAIAIEEVRETLGFILEDELMFSKVVNTSFLENQVLILKDNTQMCLMASHLPQEVEASLSQIYEENGSVLAEDAQKLLNIRIKHLQRINLALVDTIVDIADHRAIDSEVSPPEPISAILDSQTQWNWDGLWLDGRLAGYLLSQLFDEAGLLLSASPHKEYTANFYPAPLSHVNFIEAHKDKVRHLRFLSGLSAPTVQGMGMAQIQRHGLALTATTNIVLTFVASVTVSLALSLQYEIVH
ncbi:Aggrecan core protein [Portunus trituberculatus]|uniref:Aggrecan core protein n=1 Tax=Portunus trituberculatus TaxID=210409 RepID=A0A5B7D1R0_PORTR|nr:Aggrecan core protein [Portunus trituberculatus]